MLRPHVKKTKTRHNIKATIVFAIPRQKKPPRSDMDRERLECIVALGKRTQASDLLGFVVYVVGPLFCLQSTVISHPN